MKMCFNPIQDGPFRAANGWWGQKGRLPKICHTYFTMMKLTTVIPSLNKIQKHIIHVTHPLSPAEISIF